MKTPYSKSGHHPDYFLLALIIVLTVSGLVILSSASSELGTLRFRDSYYYLKHQAVNGLAVGAGGFLIALFFRYQHYRKLALAALVANLAFLAMLFTPYGITIGGSSRWLHLGLLSFQPAELLKISYIIYLAAWLTNPRFDRTKKLAEGFVPFGIVSGLVAVLLLLQPATSTVAILISAGLAVYFASGAPWRYIGGIMFAGALALALVVLITPYRFKRIADFFEPSRDIRGTGYQLHQALTAIGSGGWTGVGYGRSEKKAGLLPAPLDDSIFAIAAQEIGFVGAAGIIALFGALTFRLLWIAGRVRDRFGQLILVGFATTIALQSIVNIGAISGLMPLTGIPLPFVSYGGTALAVFLTMSGVALNISRYT